jgi:hypothetical protein
MQNKEVSVVTGIIQDAMLSQICRSLVIDTQIYHYDPEIIFMVYHYGSAQIAI